jgi:hypothetical protein
MFADDKNPHPPLRGTFSQGRRKANGNWYNPEDESALRHWVAEGRVRVDVRR